MWISGELRNPPLDPIGCVAMLFIFVRSGRCLHGCSGQAEAKSSRKIGVWCQLRRSWELPVAREPDDLAACFFGPSYCASDGGVGIVFPEHDERFLLCPCMVVGSQRRAKTIAVFAQRERLLAVLVGAHTDDHRCLAAVTPVIG